MGKYKHEGKGRNISVGGGKERSDLFKDMSGGYNAMGDSNKPSPVYNYGGNSAAKRYSQPTENQGPLHGNAFGHAMQKTGGNYTQAKSMLNMMGDPNKKMDRLSAKHKSLYDRFEMGQTSEKEEQRMFRLEDRMDKVGKKIESKKAPLNQGTRSSKRQSRPDVSTLGEKEFLNSNSFGYPTDRTQLQESAKERTSDPDYKKPKAKTLKKAPLNQGVKQGGRDKKGEPKPTSKKFPKGDVRNRPGIKGPKTTQEKIDASFGFGLGSKKSMTTGRGKTTKYAATPILQGKKVKKAAKTQAQIDKIRKSFGTKDADVSGRFERKRNKMDKTVRQLEKKGIKVDFDTTSAEGEGASRKTFVGGKKKKTMTTARGKTTKVPLNQGVKKSGGSKTKYTKEIEKNNRADSDDVIKYKKQLIEQSKQKMLQTGRGKTTSTKKTMTTGRGKTTKVPLNQGVRPSDGSLKKSYGKRHDRLRKKGKELGEKSDASWGEKKDKKSDRQYLRSRKKLDKAREIRKKQ